MPSRKKALAIAKDVLAQLKLKKLKVKCNCGYVVGNKSIKLDQIDKTAQLQEQLDKLQPKCSVFDLWFVVAVDAFHGRLGKARRFAG